MTSNSTINMQSICETIDMKRSSNPANLDFSHLPRASRDELAPALKEVLESPSDAALAGCTALLLDRALRLIRRGSRDDVLGEAVFWHALLETEGGKRLRNEGP